MAAEIYARLVHLNSVIQSLGKVEEIKDIESLENYSYINSLYNSVFRALHRMKWMPDFADHLENSHVHFQSNQLKEARAEMSLTIQ